MNTLILIENNLATSISLRYICRKSQKVSMFVQPIHIEEPHQQHFPFGAGWVRKTWEKTLVDTTKNEIETFLMTEASNCRGLTKVKIVVGDKEKEIQKELESGFYDLFVMGYLSTFDVNLFHDMIRSSFFKKLTTPVLLVKNLTNFQKVHILIGENTNVQRLLPFYLKLYADAPVDVALVFYKYKQANSLEIKDGNNNVVLQDAVKFLETQEIAPSELMEIEGPSKLLAERLRDSGMVISLINRKGKKSNVEEVMAYTPAPILIFWE